MNPVSTADSTSAIPAHAAVDGTDALTRGLVAGDEIAYRTVHERYHRRLWRYLLVVCRGSEEQAADAVQETWTRVVRHARPFASETDLWRWLAALARSAAVDGSRRRTRYGAALDRYLRWLRGGSPVEPEPSPPAGDALDTLLDQAMAALPGEDRALVRDRYWDRQSVRNLAEARETSEKAIESRLARLRSTLRRDILKHLAHEQPTPES